MDFQDKKNLSENEQSIQTRVFKALSEAKEKLKAFESQQSEPLAIVGLGCRFGHNIATPESFWSFLKAGKNHLREIPNERWNQQDFYDSDPLVSYLSKDGMFYDRDYNLTKIKEILNLS
jgi:microcystin synthetase protein McyD